MFTIKKAGLLRRNKLVADAILKPEDFDEIARTLGRKPVRARKTACIAACRTQVATTVDTRWQGEATSAKAEPGDWIVTNLDAHKSPLLDAAGTVNQYVISAEKFEQLYERTYGETEHGPVFKAKGEVDALEFPGGLDIQAPWGKQQTIKDGFLLRNGADIYGNDGRAFRATYEKVR